MTEPSTYRNLILLWAGIAIIMAGTVVWAAARVDDPLSRYIHTDKMRHILAFGAIGLCAGLLPTKLARLVGLRASVLTFAMAVEIRAEFPSPIALLRSATCSRAASAGSRASVLALPICSRCGRWCASG